MTLMDSTVQVCAPSAECTFSTSQMLYCKLLPSIHAPLMHAVSGISIIACFNLHMELLFTAGKLLMNDTIVVMQNKLQ